MLDNNLKKQIHYDSGAEGQSECWSHYAYNMRPIPYDGIFGIYLL